MEIDTAHVTFSSAVGHVDLKGISEHCFGCLAQFIGSFNKTHNLTHVVDTKWKYRYEIQGNQSLKYHFLEYGQYNIHMDSASLDESDVLLANNPRDTMLPLYILFGILATLGLIWPISKCIYRKCMSMSQAGETDEYFMELEAWESQIDKLSMKSGKSETFSIKSVVDDVQEEQQSSSKQKNQRLRSLDTFRGISIALMIFVNYSGGRYWFIDHAVWNGLCLADLVFPFFIFIMGTSIQLSYKSIVKHGTSTRKAFVGIAGRSFRLFVLGLLLNQGKSLASWRIPGVLQRFSISYFCVASLNLISSPSERRMKKFGSMKFMMIELIPFLHQWIVIVGLIVVHLGVTMVMQVEGCPKGYVGPGGLHDGGKHAGCTGGIAGFIDRHLIYDHIYAYPTCMGIYKSTLPFDPEGILGCIPSIVLTYFGLHAGRVLFICKSGKPVRMLASGLVLMGVTFALTEGTLYGGLIPINKNIWSLSFILVAAGLANLLFVVLYLLCDSWKWWNGSPFYYSGMNAIFLYVGHSLIQFNTYWHNDPQSHESYLVKATIGVSIWMFVAWRLYKQKTFFTV